MTKKTTPMNRRAKSRVILAFGESENDTRSLKHLVAAIRPELPTVETRKYPLILSRYAGRNKRLSSMEKIAKMIAAQRVTHEIISVIAHRDCDAVEPAHENSRDALLEDMRAHALPQPVAATPAFEIEAWWFLWPDALSATRPCWNKLEARPDVGLIMNAKNELCRSLKPKTKGDRCPDYTESDSVKIAEKIKSLDLMSKRSGRSRSFDAFVKQINELKA